MTTLTTEEVLKMARQAGIRKDDVFVLGTSAFVAFAKLVADREREACEKACEEECNDPDDQFKNYEDTHTDGWIDGCNSCISAIRARGEA